MFTSDLRMSNSQTEMTNVDCQNGQSTLKYFIREKCPVYVYTHIMDK